MHLKRLVLLILGVVLEFLKVLCQSAEVRLACVDEVEQLVCHVSHLVDISAHTDKLLNLVDHLMASTKNLRKSFEFFSIILSEPLSLLEKLSYIFIKLLTRPWHLFFFIDQLNDGSWQICESLLIHLGEIIRCIYRARHHLVG